VDDAADAAPQAAVPARQRILQAVIDGLPELDPAALTIQQICERAQVRAPTIYYHFGSKEGLIASAVDALVTRWIQQLDQSVDRHGPLEQVLAQAVDAWSGMITAPTRPFAVFIWLAMWSEDSREPLRRARRHAEDLIREAVVGQLGPIPEAQELAVLILDGLLGIAVDHQLEADEAALRRRLLQLVQVVQLPARAAGPAAAPTDLIPKPNEFTPPAGPTRVRASTTPKGHIE
jgi:AcrR family transcriptional regulator